MSETELDRRPFHLSRPSAHALSLLTQILEENASPTVGEIGVGFGATSIEMCRLLKNRGNLYLFDFEDKLAELNETLWLCGYHNVICKGNSRKVFDSYNWNLAQLLKTRRRFGNPELFDFVYLDGAHSFHHDAPAAVILKELVKTGGYILFDDYDWSFALSQTLNPAVNREIRDQYTDEQIRMPHVELICDLFFDADPCFSRIDIGYGSQEHRRAYRKIDTTQAAIRDD